MLPEPLAVVPVGAPTTGSDVVATAGAWSVSGDTARFTPRFPAVPGTEYAVLGHSPWQELARVTVPLANVVPRTVVERIDPVVETLPANALRFAVTFSSVMEEGSAAGRIRLLDESGVALPGTVLETPELWDRDRRRLTVLLEPGRIKRGLQPNVQAGPPLREGGTVSLLVDSGIRDAEGSQLADGARRTYRVGAPIRSRVDPALWEIEWAGPVIVRFDRPLDRALVQRCLRVLDGSGRPVPGDASLDEGARVWTFTPAANGSEIRLHIDTRLEDLAGNSVRRVFDRDLRRPEDDGIEASEIILAPRSVESAEDRRR